MHTQDAETHAKDALTKDMHHGHGGPRQRAPMRASEPSGQLVTPKHKFLSPIDNY